MTIASSAVGHGKSWCALALLVTLANTSVVEAAEVLPAPSESETDDSGTPIEIPDLALRKAVEAALGKVAGDPITRGEMATIENLYARGVRQPRGIEYAINLSSLTLYDGAISDLSPLAALTALTWINLEDNHIEDLSPLAGLTALTEIDLDHNDIVDVSHLAGLTALRTLYLGSNVISDVSPLADGFTALAELYLDGNGIEDVSPMAGLTSLTTLYLSRNEIADVTPLVGLTALEGLYLSENAIVDVTRLAGLTSLTTLYLNDNAITDVSPLADLTSLTELFLAFNTIADVSPLADLTSLKRLNLRGNTIADVSALAGLTSLTGLYLDDNWITDVSPLADLTSLTELFLAFNTIADVSPLARMTSLTTLYLTGNAIADVSALTHMKSLTGLYLEQNAVADVSPLADLTSLKWLVLGRNTIADVSPLADLTSLRWLSLYGNTIADVSPLARMTSLTKLNLTGNAIADVSPLADLTSLTTLDLWANAISDIAPLVENDGLNVGDSVDLRGNFLGLMSRETHIPMLLQRGVDVEFTDFAELPEMTDTALRRAGQWALFAFRLDDLGRLASLDASDRGVEDLTGLDGAAGLQGLFLDRNRITDISPLAGLDSLRVLTLAHNRVQNWSPLASMNSLRLLALDGSSLCELPLLPSYLSRLYLSDNCLSDVGPLANLWLWELDVSGNAITSLEPLAGQALRYLHFHDNQVADISPLNFQYLRELHMRNNAVRDISALLDGEELLMVDVRRNPLADDAWGVLETLHKRRVTVLAGETVPYFPAAGVAREGFVRIINRSGEAGHAFIEAVDDAGVRAGPVRMSVGARRAVHFNSRDLENGNAAKGLRGIGAPTAGDWRLSVISALDVEVLSYIRTGDGFVTAMHDVAADAMVPFFNPGDNRNQRSILRVVNTEAELAKWTTGGYDDHGQWHPMAGSLLVRPQHALTLTAQALEDEHGLGDGRGKWRLRTRGFPWYAMSLLESPTGHLTNLSTAPDNATALADDHTLHRLPLFPAAGGSRQGFVRVINRSYSSGEVVIEAVDDAGTRSAPVRLTMRPRRAAHFNSMDLEAGNDAKGLSAGIGAGSGDWRLELTSTLDVQVLSYIRTADGFLTSMHDLAPRSENGDLWIPFFNPGANRNQVSHLRLANSGDAPAEATIIGLDDGGQTSDAVRVTIPARAARTFTAAELETGNADGLSGALGDGKGKWRLRVATDAEVDAMSLLSLPTGHLTNLSTTPRHPPR